MPRHPTPAREHLWYVRDAEVARLAEFEDAPTEGNLRVREGEILILKSENTTHRLKEIYLQRFSAGKGDPQPIVVDRLMLCTRSQVMMAP